MRKKETLGLFKGLAEIKKCGKPDIDFYTNSVCYYFSYRLVWLIKSTSITPNQLTLLSFMFTAVGCWLMFLDQSHSNLVISAVIFQLAYIVDCADGQLARLKKQYSFIGWRLDLYSDRLKEVLIFLALGWAAVSQGGSPAYYWPISIISMGVLSFVKYMNLQESLKGTEFLDGVYHLTISPHHLQTALRLVKRIEALRLRYNLGFFNIGEFYLLLFIGLILNRIGLLLWVWLIYGLIVSTYLVFFNVTYAARKAALARQVKDHQVELCVFGLGSLGKKLVSHLKDHQAPVVALSDNDENKWGESILGYQVLPPDQAIKKMQANPAGAIIIASKWEAKIEQQLKEMGVPEEKIYSFK
jgi:phosphatidylglycerophosphate synthase